MQDVISQIFKKNIYQLSVAYHFPVIQEKIYG